MRSAPYILGFSDSLSDPSVCLFRGNEPLIAIEEERLSRVKHGLNIPPSARANPSLFSDLNLESAPAVTTEQRLLLSITYCLAALDMSLGDVDIVVGNSLHNARPFRDRALFVNHHLAHACSTFYASGFETGAILVADGYGDPLGPSTYETVLLGSGAGRRVSVLHAVGGTVRNYYDMENSLGVFYRLGTLLSGFGLMEEGKTMGLSAYGTPVYRDLLTDYVSFSDSEVLISNRLIWEELSRRLPKSPAFEVRANVAASFQAVLNDMLLHYSLILHQLTKSENLCLAGGVALNCVANAYVLERSPFKRVFVFPAPGDNGISFGAAEFVAHHVLGLPRTSRLERCDFGKNYTSGGILEALKAYSRDVQWTRRPGELQTLDAVRMLAGNEVVMWYQGGSELGPRALGNRSILANPCTAGVKDYINGSVKGREWFRPLAPAVLEEDAAEYFDGAGPSPFMVFAQRAKQVTREVAPAVVHVDGSARVQTVGKAANPLMYEVIAGFKAATGVGMVVNTSFNRKGEPLVESPRDALAAFMLSPVEALIIGNFIVKKRPAESSPRQGAGLKQVSGFRAEAR